MKIDWTLVQERKIEIRLHFSTAIFVGLILGMKKKWKNTRQKNINYRHNQRFRWIKLAFSLLLFQYNSCVWKAYLRKVVCFCRSNCWCVLLLFLVQTCKPQLDKNSQFRQILNLSCPPLSISETCTFLEWRVLLVKALSLPRIRTTRKQIWMEFVKCWSSQTWALNLASITALVWLKLCGIWLQVGE